MEYTHKSMRIQLKTWAARIEKLNTRYAKPGGQPRFDTVIYLDELKGLHAVASSGLDAAETAGDKERAPLELELKIAWDELASAMGRRQPS